MKTTDNKLSGVPAEAKKADYFIRVILKTDEGVYVCEGYKPSVKPKNPVNRFSVFKDEETGEWRMHEFMVCSGLQAGITPVNALNWKSPEVKNALLEELTEDGAVKF